MNFTPPKGTQDIYGETFYKRQRVATQILGVLTRYGFTQVQTPIIESQELMSVLAGKDMTDQMYTLKDKSGRDLVIRSDLTPAVTRLFIQIGKSLPKPLKFSVYDRIYRYERPQEGRYREIYQINAELFGAPPPTIDAELLAAFYDCYKAVGLPDTQIIIGFRPLMKRWIELWGTKETDIDAVIRAIDKRAKVSSSAFQELLTDAHFPSNNRSQLNLLLSCKGTIVETRSTMKKLAKIDKQIKEYITDLIAILDLLPLYSVDSFCRIDLGLARGFEYYTGIIFEAINPRFASSIGGGGRYDTLVAAFGGPQTSATGFSIGIDRVVSQIELNASVPAIDYAVIVEDQKDLVRTIPLAQKLRAEGYLVGMDTVGRTPSEQIALAKKKKTKNILLRSSKDEQI